MFRNFRIILYNSDSFNICSLIFLSQSTMSSSRICLYYRYVYVLELRYIKVSHIPGQFKWHQEYILIQIGVLLSVNKISIWIHTSCRHTYILTTCHVRICCMHVVYENQKYNIPWWICTPMQCVLRKYILWFMQDPYISAYPLCLIPQSNIYLKLSCNLY